MFGFWSFLPFSTSDIRFYNGIDYGLILSIQQQSEKTSHICRLISLDMEIQKGEILII